MAGLRKLMRRILRRIFVPHNIEKHIDYSISCTRAQTHIAVLNWGQFLWKIRSVLTLALHNSFSLIGCTVDGGPVASSVEGVRARESEEGKPNRYEQ